MHFGFKCADTLWDFADPQNKGRPNYLFSKINSPFHFALLQGDSYKQISMFEVIEFTLQHPPAVAVICGNLSTIMVSLAIQFTV